MSDHGNTHVKAGGIAKVMLRAIVAVIFAGIAMQLVGVALLAIPNLSFDSSNPSLVYPAFFVALVIIAVGAGITLAGTRPVIKFAKSAGKMLGTIRGSVTNAGMQGIAAPAEARLTVGPGLNVIRPALVKKEASVSTSAIKAETRPQPGTGPTKPIAQPAKNSASAPAKDEIMMGSGPADLNAVMAALNQISERYSKPDVRGKFEGWVNNLVMAFPDINKAYVYKINGSEGIEMAEGSDENAAVQVTMASDMFVKLLSKQINAIKAYSSGALKVKGEMKNLLKLRKLMF